jgi:micrococcal nuclease
MYEYRAKVVRVVDADTLDLEVDLGFTVKVKIRARLHGIDAPEIHGVKKESEEYQKGTAALVCAQDWLSHRNYRVIIRSFDGDAIGQGKYGRWLVEVWRDDDVEALPKANAQLNEYLVAHGHAERRNY